MRIAKHGTTRFLVVRNVRAKGKPRLSQKTMASLSNSNAMGNPRAKPTAGQKFEIDCPINSFMIQFPN
jgi:hypothetical protein